VQQQSSGSKGFASEEAPLIDALSRAKLQLEAALQKIVKERPALEAVLLRPGRLNADTNTGCNNTGCGGRGGGSGCQAEFTPVSVTKAG